MFCAPAIEFVAEASERSRLRVQVVGEQAVKHDCKA